MGVVCQSVEDSRWRNRRNPTRGDLRKKKILNSLTLSHAILHWNFRKETTKHSRANSCDPIDLTVLFVSFHLFGQIFNFFNGLTKTVLTFSCKSFFTWNWKFHIFLIVLKLPVNIYSRLKISMGLCPLRLTWEEWRGLGRETERLPTAQCILQSRDQTTVEPTTSV